MVDFLMCINEVNTSDSLQMRLKYTINKALMIYFPTLIPDQDLKLDIIFSKPRKIDIADPELIIADIQTLNILKTIKQYLFQKVFTISYPIKNSIYQRVIKHWK